jgi:pSer/pThr/pTyr-binding forkhead associated (FHA) protein
MAFVVFDSGPRTGESISLEKVKTVFGRKRSCDCSIIHPTVSREHFSIERTGGKFFLVDHKSGNGTFANGARISWVELKDGDRIQAGPFSLMFKSSDEIENQVIERKAEVSNESDSRHQWFDNRHAAIYPREYLEGIKHFNERRYYDAHEVWEEIWLRSSEETRLFYQMLIQAAVGLHHYERGNTRGARGMHTNVSEKLERLPQFFMSVDLKDFARQFKSFFTDLIEHGDESAPLDTKPRPTIRLHANVSDG